MRKITEKKESPAKLAKKMGASSFTNVCRFAGVPSSTLRAWVTTKRFVFDAVVEAVATHESGANGHVYKHK